MTTARGEKKLLTKEKQIESGNSPATWIATAGGVGYFPYGPGTVGSAVGIGLVALFGTIPLTPTWGTVLLSLTATVLFFSGVRAAGISERVFGCTDPGRVVIDEVVGQVVTFLIRPHPSWKLLLAGFGLFRVFDILKPFPAGRAERLTGGWGIMVDDVVAGVYAMLLVAALGYMIR